jgi:hypothetical protein
MDHNAPLKDRNAGTLAGVLACALAVLGILTIGFLFVPLAAVVNLVGAVRAFSYMSVSGIGVNVLAFILIAIGFVTSPVLWLFFIDTSG